jgi:hypothetical protein
MGNFAMGFKDRFWQQTGRVADLFALLGVPGWFAMMGSFALPAWAAYATDWLDAFGPIAWVASGFAGMMLLAASLMLYGRFKVFLATQRYINRRLSTPDQINPFDDHFSRKRISLQDLVDPVTNSITSKTFDNCDIIGPAVVYAGSPLQPSAFIQDAFINCDHVAVKRGGRVNNCIKLDACTFTKCRLIALTVLMTEAQAKLVPHEVDWITSEPRASEGVEMNLTT